MLKTRKTIHHTFPRHKSTPAVPSSSAKLICSHYRSYQRVLSAPRSQPCYPRAQSSSIMTTPTANPLYCSIDLITNDLNCGSILTDFYNDHISYTLSLSSPSAQDRTAYPHNALYTLHQNGTTGECPTQPQMKAVFAQDKYNAAAVVDYIKQLCSPHADSASSYSTTNGGQYTFYSPRFTVLHDPNLDLSSIPLSAPHLAPVLEKLTETALKWNPSSKQLESASVLTGTQITQQNCHEEIDTDNNYYILSKPNITRPNPAREDTIRVVLPKSTLHEYNMKHLLHLFLNADSYGFIPTSPRLGQNTLKPERQLSLPLNSNTVPPLITIQYDESRLHNKKQLIPLPLTQVLYDYHVIHSLSQGIIQLATATGRQADKVNQDIILGFSQQAFNPLYLTKSLYNDYDFIHIFYKNHTMLKKAQKYLLQYTKCISTHSIITACTDGPSTTTPRTPAILQHAKPLETTCTIDPLPEYQKNEVLSKLRGQHDEQQKLTKSPNNPSELPTFNPAMINCGGKNIIFDEKTKQSSVVMPMFTDLARGELSPHADPNETTPAQQHISRVLYHGLPPHRKVQPQHKLAADQVAKTDIELFQCTLDSAAPLYTTAYKAASPPVDIAVTQSLQDQYDALVRQVHQINKAPIGLQDIALSHSFPVTNTTYPLSYFNSKPIVGVCLFLRGISGSGKSSVVKSIIQSKVSQKLQNPSSLSNPTQNAPKGMTESPVNCIYSFIDEMSNLNEKKDEAYKIDNVYIYGSDALFKCPTKYIPLNTEMNDSPDNSTNNSTDNVVSSYNAIKYNWEFSSLFATHYVCRATAFNTMKYYWDEYLSNIASGKKINTDLDQMPIIILDNTNLNAKSTSTIVMQAMLNGFMCLSVEPTTPWSIQGHLQAINAASKNGPLDKNALYSAKFDVVDQLYAKNTHQVPYDAINSMFNSYEPLNGLEEFFF